MQNYWVYVIAIVALMCAVHYLSESCLVKSYSNILVVVAYLVIAFIIFSSIKWNNSWRDEKNESDNQLMIKNLVDAFLAILVIVLIYCRFTK